MTIFGKSKYKTELFYFLPSETSEGKKKFNSENTDADQSETKTFQLYLLSPYHQISLLH